jgi:hypothetical protein
MTNDVVVIGVGNPYRRDDGVGPAVIERLRRQGLDGVTLAESDGEAAALIMLWERLPCMGCAPWNVSRSVGEDRGRWMRRPTWRFPENAPSYRSFGPAHPIPTLY